MSPPRYGSTGTPRVATSNNRVVPGNLFFFMCSQSFGGLMCLASESLPRTSATGYITTPFSPSLALPPFQSSPLLTLWQLGTFTNVYGKGHERGFPDSLPRRIIF